MTRWKPDTCNCIIDYDGDFRNPVFFQQCRTHNTPQETIVHNRSFNTRDGIEPSEPQRNKLNADKAIEKGLQQFEKR